MRKENEKPTSIHDRTTTCVGLIGYGKAGHAVANVRMEDERCSLQWIVRKHLAEPTCLTRVRSLGSLADQDWGRLLDLDPVDAIVDFLHPDAVFNYGPAMAAREVMLVSANSAYEAHHLSFMTELGQNT